MEGYVIRQLSQEKEAPIAMNFPVSRLHESRMAGTNSSYTLLSPAITTSKIDLCFNKRNLVMKKIKKVLLIDDDPVTAFLNKRLISKYTLSKIVDTAPNEQEGLKWIYRNCRAGNGHGQPKEDVLVLSDLSMAALNGFIFLDAIQELEKKKLIKAPHVYLLTSTEEVKEQVIATQYHIQGFLPKALTQQDIGLLVFTECQNSRYRPMALHSSGSHPASRQLLLPINKHPVLG